MNTLKISILWFSCLTGIILNQQAHAQSGEAVVGNIRIQALSENLIRIEQRGPKGFEDRITFTVIDRKWPGDSIKIQEQEKQTILTTSKCRIDVPKNSTSIEGILVQLKNGKNQYRFKGIPPQNFCPGPVST